MVTTSECYTIITFNIKNVDVIAGFDGCIIVAASGCYIIVASNHVKLDIVAKFAATQW